MSSPASTEPILGVLERLAKRRMAAQPLSYAATDVFVTSVLVEYS